MRYSIWLLFFLVTCGSIKADDRTKMIIAPIELFCTEGASLFYISADKVVTSPPNKTQLRILRLPDGELLVDMERQLVYPVIPNVTPVFLSKEHDLIILPDLEKKGAAIGLQLPEGLHMLVNQLLHQPPPPENVAKVLSKGELIAAKLVHRAEAIEGVIREKAASLQTGIPAAPGSHPWWRAGAQYARTATERMVDITSGAVNLVGKSIEKMRQAVRPEPQNIDNVQMKGVTEAIGNKIKEATASIDKGNSDDNKPVQYRGGKSTENMATATAKAFNKIMEALRRSAVILATSLKENSVKVVQHKFGEDMGDAIGDVVQSVKNAVAAAQQIENLRMATNADCHQKKKGTQSQALHVD